MSTPSGASRPFLLLASTWLAPKRKQTKYSSATEENSQIHRCAALLSFPFLSSFFFDDPRRGILRMHACRVGVCGNFTPELCRSGWHDAHWIGRSTRCGAACWFHCGPGSGLTDTSVRLPAPAPWRGDAAFPVAAPRPSLGLQFRLFTKISVIMYNFE